MKKLTFVTTALLFICGNLFAQNPAGNYTVQWDGKTISSVMLQVGCIYTRSRLAKIF